MVKYAFAGFRHGHIYRLLDLVLKNENTEIVGAWEENEASKKDAADNHGVTFTYDSYEALLADPAVDVVAIGDYYGRRGAMVIAALATQGRTEIEEIQHIERGYDDIVGKLRGVGADIRKINIPDPYLFEKAN